jgi:short-subunit dehydrogenase
MDVCNEAATESLQELIDEMGGMDVLFINSGYGKSIHDLDASIEIQTVKTNVLGFTNLMVFGFNYFKNQQKAGQIVVTSSVASVRALRRAPSYSASKRYMRHYVDCLAQKAHHEKLDISFTTLMPGFIDTDFLSKEKYPLMVPLSKVGGSIFNAIEKKKRAVYLPFRWNFVVFVWHLIPKWVWERYC